MPRSRDTPVTRRPRPIVWPISLTALADALANAPSIPHHSDPAQILNIENPTFLNDQDEEADTSFVYDSELEVSEAYEGNDHEESTEADGSEGTEEEDEGEGESDGYAHRSSIIARDLAAYRASLQTASINSPYPSCPWTAAMALATDAMRSRTQRTTSPAIAETRRVPTYSRQPDSDSDTLSDPHSGPEADAESDSSSDDYDDEGNREDQTRAILENRVLSARRAQVEAERAERVAWKRAHPPTSEAWELAYRSGMRVSEAYARTRAGDGGYSGMGGYMYVGRAASVSRSAPSFYEGDGHGSYSALTERYRRTHSQTRAETETRRAHAHAQTLYTYGPSDRDEAGRELQREVEHTRRAAIDAATGAANKRFWAERELGDYLLRSALLDVEGGCQSLEDGPMFL